MQLLKLNSLFGARRYCISLPGDLYPCNPSIARDGANFRMTVRGINYHLMSGGLGISIPLHEIKTSNWLVYLDRHLRVTGVQTIDDQNIRDRERRAARGLEDARLFKWRDNWWYLASGLSNGPPSTTMALCRLEENQTVEVKFITSPLGRQIEKNWMPVVDGESLQFLYRISPLSIISVLSNDEFVFREIEHGEADEWSGSSQLVRYHKNWLCVIHRRIMQNDLPVYQHAFAELNQDFRVIRVSDPWCFDHPTVEFCAGLCLTERHAIISYGYFDREARIVKLPLSIVGHLLRKSFISHLILNARYNFRYFRFRRQLMKSDSSFLGHADQCFGHVTYSQSGEDMYIANIFAKLKIEKPAYLDLGGHHPFACSNTAWLYMCGSSGVVIEASPDLVAPFQKARARDKVLNVGVGTTRGKLPFYRIDPWSGRNSFSKRIIEDFCRQHPKFKLYDTIEVDVLTINDIIDRYCSGKFPEFLSIDVEGSDFEILESADFSSSKPIVICTEIVTGADDVSTDKISALLKKRGYARYAVTWGNAIFVDDKYSSELGLSVNY